MIDYGQLATELNTDPLDLGYAPLLAAGADGSVAALMNTPGVGAAYLVNQLALTAATIIAAFDATEFAALAQVQLSRLQIILSTGTVNLANTNTKLALAGIFPNPSTTRTNVLALVQKQGSRGEVLFGTGTSVRADDISKALRG